jgi:predicted Zn-dependent protease
MLDILKLFKGQEVFNSTRIDPYALTHPLSSERIGLLESRIEQSPAKGRALDPKIAYWHERMRAKLDGFIEPPERVLARILQDADPNSEFNLYRRAVAEHRMARADDAIVTTDALLKIRPDDPFYWELQGQILFESARPADAVAPLRRAVRLAPDEPLIAGLLGRALLASGAEGAEKEALSTLKEAARKDPGEAGVLRDLATAYARAGEDGMAALTTAERIALGGDLSDAAMMARRAMALLPEGSPGWLRAEDIASLDPRLER